MYIRLQNSRFRKAGSAVSVILECEARESHTPCGRLPRRFFSLSCLSFEYGQSLAFAKNTAVLQSNITLELRHSNSCHLRFAILYMASKKNFRKSRKFWQPLRANNKKINCYVLSTGIFPNSPHPPRLNSGLSSKNVWKLWVTWSEHLFWPFPSFIEKE